MQSGQTERDGVTVLCTNPADLSDSAATAPLLPYFWIAGRPSRQLLSTDWVAFPSLYTAECHDNDGASWLQVNDIGTASDIRTRLHLTTVRRGAITPSTSTSRSATSSTTSRPR